MRAVGIMSGLLLMTSVALAGEPKVGDIVSLPKPATDGKLSLERTLGLRRSLRAYADRALTRRELGQLAWAAQGITDAEHGWRTAPSAGNVFFIDLYVVTPKVVYHYLPSKHAFQVTAVGTPRADLGATISKKFPWAATAPAIFVVTADLTRSKKPWGQRGVRFATIEVGAVVQNIHLQAVALRLSGCCIGGYNDAKVQEIVAAPKTQSPLILFTVGARKGYSH